MTTVEFTKEFATKKKGDLGTYDGSLASRLIAMKVAKIHKPKKTTKK